ncbi:MAG: hypothetical protein WBX25_31950 [Rhodomicrobium sp.]
MTPTDSEKLLLDRLMAAESGGRLNAANPLSSAFGPYQFIRDTFLDVMQRRFPELTAGKSTGEILSLRAAPEIARNAALIYTRENAAFLSAHGAPVTAGSLRLAFFAGPSGAIKVLAAKPEERVANLLSAAALQANPWMREMTAVDLIARTAREAGGTAPLSIPALAVAMSKAEKPKIDVRCNMKLASCRKWLALAEKRSLLVQVRLGSPKAATSSGATLPQGDR